MIVMMAGLPGTGKSTLSRALAVALNGAVVDKDTVRAALFDEFVDYSREQDDLAMESVYSAAVYLARSRAVFIDGRAFALREQWERGLTVASVVIETVCLEETARARIEAAKGEHLAGNRTFQLFLELKARREPITAPKLQVNTERPLKDCVRECVEHMVTAGFKTTHGTLGGTV